MRSWPEIVEKKSSQIVPVMALNSNLIHVNEVFFRQCPAVFIPGMTLVVHFCYFVVKNLTGLFYFSLAVAQNDVSVYSERKFGF